MALISTATYIILIKYKETQNEDQKKEEKEEKEKPWKCSTMMPEMIDAGINSCWMINCFAVY